MVTSLAVASRFLSEGARLVLVDLLDLEAGELVARQLSETHASYVRCDVATKGP